jgi:hypothetical protein
VTINERFLFRMARLAGEARIDDGWGTPIENPLKLWQVAAYKVSEDY